MKLEDFGKYDEGKKLLNRIRTLEAQISNLEEAGLVQIKSKGFNKNLIYDIPIGTGHDLEPFATGLVDQMKEFFSEKLKVVKEQFDIL